MVCNHRLWNFERHFGWNLVELAAKSLFSVPRLFHGKENSLPAGWHPERERFAQAPDVQTDRQQIRHPLVQQNLRWVQSRANGRLRFTHGANHGLGNVSRYGPTSTGMVYPSSNVKFSGEGGIPNLGTLVAFTRNDNNTERQFDWFVPNKANGITQAGRSIEAFLYCILLGPRLMCEAAFFAMEAERKKRRASFSHCWSTLSGSQTWPTACSASSWLLQSKGETWSCGGNERTKGRKSGRLSLPMTRMLRFLLFLSFNCYPPLLIAVILRWLIFWLHQ